MTSAHAAPIEAIYECLAEAIDRAGAANEALFLAKLALVLGHQLGDSAQFRQAIELALQDLPEPEAGDVPARPRG